MAATTLDGVLLKGVAASRPAATAVAKGTIYSATDTGAITQSDGATWSAYATISSSATRASLGLDTTDSPEFAGINVGHASDTTLTRASAGNLAVEGNALYRAGGTDVPIADGGTGASTKAAAFDALSPMTTAGDIIIGGASGTGTRLAAGTSTHVLTSNGAGSAPSWQAGGGGGGGSDLVQTYSGGGSVYIPGMLGSPDRLPASPHASDLEFNASSGTVLGTLDVDNFTTYPSHWMFERTTGSVEVNGRYWTLPSLPCTITAKFNSVWLAPGGLGYPALAILLLDSTPTAIREFSYNQANNGQVGFSLRHWASRTSFSSAPADVALSTTASVLPLFETRPIWLRLLVTSATSMSMSYSWDGFKFASAGGALTGVNPSMTPAFFGIGTTNPVNATSATAAGVCDWVRIT